MKKTVELTPEIKADLLEAFSTDDAPSQHWIIISALNSLVRHSGNSEELRLTLYQAADACVDAVQIMDAVLDIPNANNIPVVRISDQAKYCKQVAMKEIKPK